MKYSDHIATTHYQSLPTLKIEVNIPETRIEKTRLSVILTVLYVQNRKNNF
jgi:hypothetical protein